MKQMIIGCDMDGTIITNRFPEIEELVPGARETIHALRSNGHKVFLFTVRGVFENMLKRNTLAEAIRFLEDNDIKLDGYNQSPWQPSDSPKQFADLYIDDSSLGVPTYIYHGCRVVNWAPVAAALMMRGLITQGQYNNIAGVIRSNICR